MLLELAEQIVESDAVAADDDEIRKLQLAIEELHVDERAGRHDLFVAADRRDAIGAAERRDAAGPLAHGVCSQTARARPLALDRAGNQTDEQVLRPPDL